VGVGRRGNAAIEMLLSSTASSTASSAWSKELQQHRKSTKKIKIHEDRGLRECREVGVGRQRIANKTHLLSHSPPPRTDPPRMTARLSEGAPHLRRKGIVR
jgi:hypothetical protein